MKNEIVFLSLGSNLGDRESNLAQATAALSINYQVSNLVSSSYYESEPLYNKDQPLFLNSVLKFSTKLNPFEILDITQKVEKMLGRSIKKQKNQPRIIDIDIILFDDLVLAEKNLKIPHPKFHERNFVLLPLIEINNQLINPKTNITVEDYLKNIKPDNSIEKLNFNYQEV